MSRRRLDLALVAACGLFASAVACGPDFPNRYLAAPESELLAAPEAVFADEIARLAESITVPWRAVATTREAQLAIELEELRAALAAEGFREPRIARAVDAYRRTREAVEQSMAPTALPPEIPPEFTHYFAGAVAWRREQWREARAAWEQVMALPEAQRRHSSVRTAFMLGRWWERVVENGPEADRTAAAREARTWFQRAREFARTGSADPPGLAAASLGREARVELLTENHVPAIGLYLAQHAAGDQSARASLLWAARAAAASEGPARRKVAADPLARRVVTGWLLAGNISGSYGAPRDARIAQLGAWAGTLSELDLAPVEETDRLAWLAYRGGQFALAQRWLALAPAEAPLANWVRAKFALREGRLRDAEQLLAGVTAEGLLAPGHRQLALAELGRTRLALDDGSGALAAWLDGGHWQDCAYLAESVLTLDELLDYVEAHCPEESASGATDREWWEFGAVRPRVELRYLLGRRLAREGRATEAVTFLPAHLREEFTAYVEDVRTGFEAARPAAERAEAFWRAARAVRENGLAWLATELEPDWAIWNAGFDSGSAAHDRLQLAAPDDSRFAPTVFERERLEKRTALPGRFSYRYRAAELGWWAASLLPNDSNETARILYEAGGWLKVRDPKAAERFYQALVIRCGNTALGRAAAEKRWFPEGDAAGNPAGENAAAQP